MSVESLSFTQVFGFHNERSIPYGYLVAGGPNHKVVNLTNLLGYLPILGVLTCIARIAMIKGESRFWRAPLGFKAAFVTRGLFEMLGAGLLFLIPDLIASMGRWMGGYYKPDLFSLTDLRLSELKKGSP